MVNLIGNALAAMRGGGGLQVGLWICADIVAGTWAGIAARSNDAPGRNGSVFRVFLPL